MEKAISIAISIHSVTEQIVIELVTCMGYFWEYQVCNWTGTVTIQTVVLLALSVYVPNHFLADYSIVGFRCCVGGL
jgi:hypothetical protein